jgi:hypothetical protein
MFFSSSGLSMSIGAFTNKNLLPVQPYPGMKQQRGSRTVCRHPHCRLFGMSGFTAVFATRFRIHGPECLIGRRSISIAGS